MKAVLITQYRKIPTALSEIPEPQPGPRDVLVSVRAAGVNYPDWLVVHGKYQALPPLPFIPGKEFSGVVKRVGSAVTELRPGQRVMAYVECGAFAEQIVVPAAACIRIPERLDDVSAAAFGVAYLTAFFGLIHRARFQRGEWVLVTGATGGVGMASVQLAKALGARVLAGIGSPEKREIAQQLGADYVIDFGGGRDTVRSQVRDATGGRGADIVLELVGGETFEAAMRSLAWRGRLVVIGFASGQIPNVRLNHVLLKQIEIIGLQLREFRERTPDLIREASLAILNLWHSGQLPVPLTETLPLELWYEALNRLGSRKAIGKVVLTVDH